VIDYGKDVARQAISRALADGHDLADEKYVREIASPRGEARRKWSLRIGIVLLSVLLGVDINVLRSPARMSEIERAYSRFVVTELPAGYEGEVAEAYNNLLLAGIETTPDNILLYLKAKASLMEYLRADGATHGSLRTEKDLRAKGQC
jgi:hypothetical protein